MRRSAASFFSRSRPAFAWSRLRLRKSLRFVQTWPGPAGFPQSGHVNNWIRGPVSVERFGWRGLRSSRVTQVCRCPARRVFPHVPHLTSGGRIFGFHGTAQAPNLLASRAGLLAHANTR